MLIQAVRNIIGAKLVAYLGSAKETRAARQWTDGVREPSAEPMSRLSDSHHVAVLLAEQDTGTVVQAWFQGMNPELDDVAPASLMRKSPLDEAGPAVLAAPPNFKATSDC